jgi:hypothetical protein
MAPAPAQPPRERFARLRRAAASVQELREQEVVLRRRETREQARPAPQGQREASAVQARAPGPRLAPARSRRS